MSQKKEPSLAQTIADPRAFVLSLIGAEVLTRKNEEGPLARPHRIVSRRRSIPPIAQDDRGPQRG